MAKSKLKYGGGWPAIRYSWKMAKRVGGIFKFFQSLRSKNVCKACAVGMWGMKNEAGQTLEVCKKSMQAQAQDMSSPISPLFWVRHSMEDLLHFSGHQLESAGRLSQPLYAGPGFSHFQVLSYERAHEILMEHWKKASPSKSYFYASGRSSMEAAYLLHLLARQWGTNNVNNCSYYCHQASGVSLKQALGGGTSTIQLEDIGKADLLVILGANPASNHPRLIKFALELRRRKGKVIIINPFQELGLKKFKVPSDWKSLLFGSTISDLYLQPHCGGDLALLKAAAVKLHQEGKSNIEFLKKYCDHTEEFLLDLEKSNWRELLSQSGVEEESFHKFVAILSSSSHGIFAWAMGITHQLHGVENIRAIANLALLLGMVGKPGAGLLPIRGHSNVQGVGSTGVVPTLTPQMAQALAEHLKITIPTTPGMDTFSCLEAAHRGEIAFAFHLGGNLWGASPDLKWAQEAFEKIPFTVYLNTTLNAGHLRGRGQHCLILPVLARDEEKQATTQESMFNYVRVSEGGAPPPSPKILSETEILVKAACDLLEGSPLVWSELYSHEKIRHFIGQTVSYLKPLSKIDQEKDKEFTIPGRIKHTPEFNTDTGRAKLAVLTPPDVSPGPGKFNLLTFRSEGQFNTIIYEEEDIYRGVSHRNVVFISQEDMKNLGLREGEYVRVKSEIGSMEVEAVEGPIRAGNVAMYFPEANAIVPSKLDPQSRTPAYKRIEVSIQKL